MVNIAYSPMYVFFSYLGEKVFLSCCSTKEIHRLVSDKIAQSYFVYDKEREILFQKPILLKEVKEIGIF